MKERMYMPEISEEEFMINIEKDDFLCRYGNPVLIREKNGDGLVCMAAEYYERMMQELEGFREEEKIRYWIYEFEMPQEIKEKLERIAAKNEMTVDEFCESVLLSAVRHPEEAESVCREYEQQPDKEPVIRLVRSYPVYKWETEAQALKRAITEEEAGKRGKPETEPAGGIEEEPAGPDAVEEENA